MVLNSTATTANFQAATFQKANFQPLQTFKETPSQQQLSTLLDPAGFRRLKNTRTDIRNVARFFESS
jgi:hypothetical protein